ncbi:hypothetical protein P280DRAFT_488252 [Massarina eburnea CBS 473.64]|uniref:UBX domain-containing protein 2 n=1 Tax=Massarina eburnea CBS 473.64 TaxID=1395130 RepID=A0A6A6S671_9PLEO|nr:hypothetical protein P280DRAFT_488252 [Massarina eburnea CBS 473.64]
MFHEGNLQSGISLAIQQQKLVGILVRDDGAESAQWETDFLTSGWVANLLEQAAILLRLEAGSTEAGYLSAFCTISSTPTFVIIHNGQLKEQLSSGTTQDEFINRVRKVLGASPIPGTAPVAATSQAARPAAPTLDSGPPPLSSVPTLPPTTRNKGKQKATEPESKPRTSTPTAAQQAARDSLRKKKQEEKDELARIKARIDQDKAERKAQAEARKAEREREKQAQATSAASEPQFTATSTRGSQAKDVHLNVRLFDGRTVRKTFPRIAKLEGDVRPWVDQEAAARAENPNETPPPYYFKQILAPLPSKELSAGEEAEALGDIDLAPSATLVLVPVKGYTEAYSGGPAGIVQGTVGNVTGLVGGVFGMAGSVLGYVGNTVSSVLGGGASNPQNQPSGGRALGESQPQDQSAGASNVRVRTLADQRAREQGSQNFYNGNQLNFEPRDEDSNR